MDKRPSDREIEEQSKKIVNELKFGGVYDDLRKQLLAKVEDDVSFFLSLRYLLCFFHQILYDFFYRKIIKIYSKGLKISRTVSFTKLNIMKVKRVSRGRNLKPELMSKLSFSFNLI